MASPYTAADIIRRARQKADMMNTGYITAQEEMDLLNETYCELYDLLVSSFEEYFIVDDYFVDLVPGTYNYALPDDFYKGVGVDFQLNMSATSFITLKPFSEMERNGLTGVIGAIPTGRVKLRYIPQPVIYTATTDAIDTKIAGWETLLVVNMAIAMRSKEESQTADLERAQAKLMERITINASNRDIGFPARVNDVYKVDVWNQWASLRYQYSGDFVRFLPTVMEGFAFTGISG